jgi:3-deoxy-D-manno-octulosonic-acid transferase
LSRLAVIAVQDTTYASRFQALGPSPEHIQVTGSLKFDGAESDRGNPVTASLRCRCRFRETDVVFVAGSTQRPEEAIALQVFRDLSTDFPALKLVVVPRHPERFDEVADLIRSFSLPYVRWTEYRDSPEEGDPPRIVLVDTIGELRHWWGLADLAFVGGSLSSRGGQNMIEPAAYGAAICFGPNTRNFADVVTLFLQSNAAVVVQDERELMQFVRQGLESPTRRAELQRAAASVVERHRGATCRTVAALEGILETSNQGPSK